MSTLVKKVVISAPDGWGDVASDLWAPAEAVYFAKQVQGLGFQPVVLRGPDANKSNYDKAVLDPDTVMICGVGHGNNTVFTGYKLRYLEYCPVPQHKYDNKIWCPVSCLVGNQLAPEIVQNSANAASVGEITEYWFTADTSKPHNGEDPISEDIYLATFQMPEFKFRLALLQGYSLADAWQILEYEYKTWRDYWYQKGEPDVGDTAWYDWVNRRRWGPDDWKIPGTQPPPTPPPVPKETQIKLNAYGKRDPCRHTDTLYVEGNVTDKDGNPVQGTVTVKVKDKSIQVHTDSDGNFDTEFVFSVDHNDTGVYDVRASFQPDDKTGYEPSTAEGQGIIQPAYCPTQIQFTGINYTVEGAYRNTITVNVEGILLASGNPLPNAQVEVRLGDGDYVNTYATTGSDGKFRATLTKTFPPFPSGFTVVAIYGGDEWNSKDTVTEPVKISGGAGDIAGLIAFIIAILLAILSYLGI
jgi:hypothetical protein